MESLFYLADMMLLKDFLKELLSFAKRTILDILTIKASKSLLAYTTSQATSYVEWEELKDQINMV